MKIKNQVLVKINEEWIMRVSNPSTVAFETDV